MATGELWKLWNEWEIQILVLASFTLQVFLLVFGGMRRRCSSTVLRIALWLAYLLADSTAIYTLGHLSVAAASHKHQLAAFWAPFLLLHLGGPDNITAYALEDNSLWLRHLQTLVVQVLGAAYVIYKYMAGSRTFLLRASVSMFVVGVLKYGERIWALRCGNISRIGNSSTGNYGVGYFELLERLRSRMSEEEVLLLVHSQLDMCKGVFADTLMSQESSVLSEYTPTSVTTDLGQYLYKSAEMELSLMYDILYTKAAVVHTFYGCCIHLISLLGTAITFLLFQHRSRGDGHSRADVIISYVLLVGALVLEVLSACRALLSSWTCWFLHSRGWNLLLAVVTCLRRRVQPASRSLWQGSIGQYNLFHRCTRDKSELGSRLTLKMGVQDWWNKLHFSGTFSPSDSFSMEDLKTIVLQSLDDTGYNLNSRGISILKHMGVYEKLARWSVNIDFDESILVWHIATDVYIHISKARHAERLMKATKVLSDYMMFLLVVKPDLLPGRSRHRVYLDILKELEQNRELLTENCQSQRSWNPCCILKELFYHDGPTDSRITEREKLAEKLHTHYKRMQDDGDHGETESQPEMDVKHGVFLGIELHCIKLPTGCDMLKLILGVWVEMMLYAAERCRRDSHARQLSNGGEFITIIWLLSHHRRYIQQTDPVLRRRRCVTRRTTLEEP